MTKISKSAMRRAAKELLAQQADPTPLHPDLQAKLDRYRPRADERDRTAIEPVFRTIMMRSQIASLRTFKDNLSALSGYLLHTHANGRPLTVEATMTFHSIETYVTSMTCSSQQSRASIRSSLRSLAGRVNPGLDAPPKAPTIAARGVRPPYTPAEVASIIRIARSQPNAITGRQLQAIVALGLGAGLGPGDLRSLRRQDIDDRGDDGIIVTIRTGRTRSVMMRRDYEDLLRSGLDGLAETTLVTGRLETRKNPGCKVVERSTILSESAPHIEMTRLRSTWLTWLLERPIPLHLIMAASGLTSAHTLTDLLGHLTPPDGTLNALTREEGDPR